MISKAKISYTVQLKSRRAKKAVELQVNPHRQLGNIGMIAKDATLAAK
jgi:hypothetical protein